MHPWLTQSLDRLIIRLACRGMSPPGRHPPHAEEAAELLNHPDFFCDFVEAPRDFDLSVENVFKFKSPIITPWEKNNWVHGKFFPCASDWQKFPTTILLHGWNDEMSYQFRFPRLSRQLGQQKINTAVMELPYHLQRRPRDPNAINNFISEDLWRMVEATRQSIADVRALVKWFHAQGCEKVGLWGTSLGAWLAGLIVCHEPQVGFAVLTTPVAKIHRAINELGFCEPIRRSYEKTKIDLARLDLVSHRPKISSEKILIHEAENDLFAPKEAIEEFWKAWDKPEIWRVRHGHISILMSVSVRKRTVQWIADCNRARHSVAVKS
jgi:dienelactone hydrolase